MESVDPMRSRFAVADVSIVMTSSRVRSSSPHPEGDSSTTTLTVSTALILTSCGRSVQCKSLSARRFPSSILPMQGHCPVTCERHTGSDVTTRYSSFRLVSLLARMVFLVMLIKLLLVWNSPISCPTQRAVSTRREHLAFCDARFRRSQI